MEKAGDIVKLRRRCIRRRSEDVSVGEICTASQIFKEVTTDNVIWLLDKAIHKYAKPREILTDHGSQFWSVRRGESSFEDYCHQKKIKHILGGIGKPTSLGKIERWF